MDFRLVHAEYDRETERAYVELRAPDDDDGEAITTAIFSFRTTGTLSKRQIEEGASSGWPMRRKSSCAGGRSCLGRSSKPMAGTTRRSTSTQRKAAICGATFSAFAMRKACRSSCRRCCSRKNGLKAARLALVGEREGWIPAFSRAVFVANYAQQKDISDDGTLRTILAALGVDAALAAANAPETTAEQSGVLYATVDTEQDLVDALEKTLD